MHSRNKMDHRTLKIFFILFAIILFTHRLEAREITYSIGTQAEISETIELDGIKSRLGSGGILLGLQGTFEQINYEIFGSIGRIKNADIDVSVAGRNRKFNGDFQARKIDLKLLYQLPKFLRIPMTMNIGWGNSNAKSTRLKNVSDNLNARSQNSLTQFSVSATVPLSLKGSLIKPEFGISEWTLKGIGTSFLTDTVHVDKEIKAHGIDPFFGIVFEANPESNLPILSAYWKQYTIAKEPKQLISFSLQYNF